MVRMPAQIPMDYLQRFKSMHLFIIRPPFNDAPFNAVSI